MLPGWLLVDSTGHSVEMTLHAATPMALDLRLLLSTGPLQDVLLQFRAWCCSYGSRLDLSHGHGSSLALCDSMLPMLSQPECVVADHNADHHPSVDCNIDQQVIQACISASALVGSTQALEFSSRLSEFGLAAMNRLVPDSRIETDMHTVRLANTLT